MQSKIQLLAVAKAGEADRVERPAFRPAFGTAPIRCGNTRCKWRGFETLLADEKDGPWTRYVCPTCGHDSYMFMTPREIKAWERSKTLNEAMEGDLQALERKEVQLRGWAAEGLGPT